MKRHRYKELDATIVVKIVGRCHAVMRRDIDWWWEPRAVKVCTGCGHTLYRACLYNFKKGRHEDVWEPLYDGLRFYIVHKCLKMEQAPLYRDLLKVSNSKGE